MERQDALRKASGERHHHSRRVWAEDPRVLENPAKIPRNASKNFLNWPEIFQINSPCEIIIKITDFPTIRGVAKSGRVRACMLQWENLLRGSLVGRQDHHHTAGGKQNYRSRCPRAKYPRVLEDQAKILRKSPQNTLHRPEID
ncbi:MAG: hypothetical protein RBG13Loki_1427 [Promethearchaeota archaeon CR_4]|nr:MAG: hypothetical protein RBG13Loki_1427 [Candidatus Lokiarchaeota archaeon CR_4]